jgi:hypothetical protein
MNPASSSIAVTFSTSAALDMLSSVNNPLTAYMRCGDCRPLSGDFSPGPQR